MKILQYLQSNTSRKTKIILPLLLTYLIILLTTIIPLPSYALIGIASLSTFMVYLFIGFVLDSEQVIIKEHEKQLNDFHEMFVNLSEENKKLSGELESFFTDFDSYVISSKTDLFGTITWTSLALQKISGYSEEEFLGTPHNILRHPDMPAAAFKEMWETIEDNRIWSGEIKNLKKCGGFYWVRAIVSPIYDTEGGKIGYNSIRQDITNIKGEYSNEDRRGNDRRSVLAERRKESRD